MVHRPALPEARPTLSLRSCGHQLPQPRGLVPDTSRSGNCVRKRGCRLAAFRTAGRRQDDSAQLAIGRSRVDPRTQSASAGSGCRLLYSVAELTTVTERLHCAFLDALSGHVLAHGDLRSKPLNVDLELPLPPRLRLYLYSLVVGGKTRPGEFKVVLRVPGQSVGHYGTFDHSGDRLAVLVGYREDLDVFVLWDASLHEKFKHGGNMQVRDTVVAQAAAIGWAEQRRPLRSGTIEVVLACRSRTLARALTQRVAWTGGVLKS